MPNRRQPSPYPSVFDLYGELAGALGTRQTSDQNRIAKNLNRAKRGELRDFRVVWSLLEDLFVDPLSTTRAIPSVEGKELAEGVREAVRELASCQLAVMKDVPVDALTRDQVLPLLRHYFYLPLARRFLDRLNYRWPGPSLEQLTDPRRHPIEVVLGWAEAQLGLEVKIERAVYPDSTGSDKRWQDAIAQRWRRQGRHPSRTTIGSFCRHVAESSIGNSARAILPRLYIWLMAASALAYFEPASGKALRTSVSGDDDDGCRVGLRDAYRDDVRAFAHLYLALDNANTTQGPALGDLPEAGQRLLISVAPKTFKKPKDETRLSQAIREYEERAAELDRTGYTDYGIAWIKARYHACAWEYRTSLDHYNTAVDLAMHRAGGTVLRKIVDEAAALAAHVGDRVAAKNLIDLRVVAGLAEPPDGSTRDASVADDEIDKLRRDFYFKFPQQGLFKSVDAEAWAESVG